MNQFFVFRPLCPQGSPEKTEEPDCRGLGKNAHLNRPSGRQALLAQSETRSARSQARYGGGGGTRRARASGVRYWIYAVPAESSQCEHGPDVGQGESDS